MQRPAVLSAVGVLVIATVELGAPVTEAGPIVPDSFYEFSYTEVGFPATGCTPADPSAPFCIASLGTSTQFLDAPPWTFAAPAAGALLSVVDAFESGDRFEAFDFGVSLGLTSAPGDPEDCGDDPAPCLADSDMSQGFFALSAGPHSITLVPVASPGGSGAGYLRWATVPEPATIALVASGLVALAHPHRRRGARR
jgi:hypothetical protein